MKAKDLKRIIKEELLAILAENAPAPTTAPPKTTPKTRPGNPGLTPTPGKTPKERPAKAVKKDEKDEVKEDKAATLVKGIMNKYKKLKK
jgi:hypothetical protein